VGMINDTSSRSVFLKTLLHRFVPLVKVDSPEPSGQGVYLFNSTFNIKHSTFFLILDLSTAVLSAVRFSLLRDPSILSQINPVLFSKGWTVRISPLPG
jgi:hypothetical protein